MSVIEINASKSYTVNVLENGFEHIPSLIPRKPKFAVIVSDEKVAGLYLETVKNSIEESGIKTLSFIIPQGEISKSVKWYGKLLSFLATFNISRSDMLFALGGGVTGDLTGFAAATYLRGIEYVQLPTTLLAAVDSSVGGKTAINLPEGKNLAGCFYQPSSVICNIHALSTLDDSIFADGCAEIIKYAVLGDDNLFTALEDYNLLKNRNDRSYEAQIVKRCVEIKRDFVMQDEKDTGIRNILNLGHTFGHAVEICSNFTVSHGRAVSIGLAIVCDIAVKHGICRREDAERIIHLLTSYDLPVSTEIPFDLLFEVLKRDKKISQGKLRLILPEKIGKCYIEEISIDSLYNYLKV